MTDNIKGLKGIGPVKASKLLDECTSNKQMHDVCDYMYGVHHREYVDMSLNGHLLWMKRSPDSTWEDLINVS